MKGIKRAIADSHKSVKFKQVLGTLENFKFIVTMKPHVLHITCHGDYAKGNSTGTLTMETEDGDGRHINQEDLLYNLKLQDIMLVFVAACKSDRIGDMLMNSDVSHVICSKKNNTLVDQTTVEFTQALYRQILLGIPVCQAFYNAKNEITKAKGDQKAQKFQLKLAKNHKPQDCYKFWKGKPGQIQCISDHIKYKSVQSKIKHFIDR